MLMSKISDFSELAVGAVGTGFRFPTVARYNGNGAPGSHTDGRRLARGVRMSLNVQTADGNVFYADDGAAESNSARFSSGTMNLTVDGLLPESERMVNGLPEEELVKVGERDIPITRTGDDATAPNVGYGAIRVYESNGIELFRCIILPKVCFRQAGFDAETRTEQKNYQAQDLVADILRIEHGKRDWRWLGALYTTVEEAMADMDDLLAVPREAANG